jgi:hypothetical protein
MTVDRLLDFEHPSRMETVEEALAALGKRVVVTFVDSTDTKRPDIVPGLNGITAATTP